MSHSMRLAEKMPINRVESVRLLKNNEREMNSLMYFYFQLIHQAYGK